MDVAIQYNKIKKMFGFYMNNSTGNRNVFIKTVLETFPKDNLTEREVCLIWQALDMAYEQLSQNGFNPEN